VFILGKLSPGLAYLVFLTDDSLTAFDTNGHFFFLSWIVFFKYPLLLFPSINFWQLFN